MAADIILADNVEDALDVAIEGNGGPQPEEYGGWPMAWAAPYSPELARITGALPTPEAE